MSLASDKRLLTKEINRYKVLLSNLNDAPIKAIDRLDFMLGLVDVSNNEEIEELKKEWQHVRPNDDRSVKFLETGKLTE